MNEEIVEKDFLCHFAIDFDKEQIKVLSQMMVIQNPYVMS